MTRVCFARVDRIGDLVLTLPCEKIWRQHRSGDQVEWLISSQTRFVIEHVEPKTSAFFVSGAKGLVGQVHAAIDLKKVLTEKNFDEAILFHVPWWVAFSFWLARVPLRMGPASQWFSWLFFNKRLRQKRSQALMHESEYNAELVAFALGINASHVKVEPAKLVARAEAMASWKKDLAEKRILADRFVVIHPGMGGSARNWNPENYRKLAEKFLEKNISVVLTGTSNDLDFISQTGLDHLPGVLNLSDKTSGSEMLALLGLAKVVIAPSTGVAHLAASLDRKVIAIYSPVKVQAPKRWRPLGKNVHVFVPEVECPGTFQCLGKVCKIYDCMERISVDQVFNECYGLFDER